MGSLSDLSVWVTTIISAVVKLHVDTAHRILFASETLKVT